ncbi:transcriptional regulator, LuxR family domain protein [gut metagenome]|uniref:Transcriptional regulator, LuxR family domain protein n=1 Tax=gut metagenome TaxID=749906 RepID=J9H552_9ZZZZ
MHSPEIAIIDPNTLTCLGLQHLIQELLPQAVVRVFPSFAALTDDTPDMYAHYFVAAQVYFEHTNFFRERHPKAIVLAGGAHLPHLSGVPQLNIFQSEDGLRRDIGGLHDYGHPHRAPKHPTDGDNTGSFPTHGIGSGHAAQPGAAPEVSAQAAAGPLPPTGPIHPAGRRETGRNETELSPREVEVLILITRGLINKEIAERLHISLTTVISHRKNLTEKLGIKSVSGLTVYAVMNGYIEADKI